MESPNGPVLSLKPDVLIESPDGNIIVDIKWKRLDINPRTHTFSLGSADLYQLYAYTRRYGVKGSIIIFPKVHGATEVAYHPLGLEGIPDETTVSINLIDLSENLGTTPPSVNSESKEVKAKQSTLEADERKTVSDRPL